VSRGGEGEGEKGRWGESFRVEGEMGKGRKEEKRRRGDRERGE